MNFDTDIKRSIYKFLQSIDSTMYIEGMDRDQLSDEWFEPRVYPIEYSDEPGGMTIRVRLNILAVVTLPKTDIYKMTRLKDKILATIAQPIPIEHDGNTLFCLYKHKHTSEDYGQPSPAVKLEQSVIQVPTEGYYDGAVAT